MDLLVFIVWIGVVFVCFLPRHDARPWKALPKPRNLVAISTGSVSATRKNTNEHTSSNPEFLSTLTNFPEELLHPNSASFTSPPFWNSYPEYPSYMHPPDVSYADINQLLPYLDSSHRPNLASRWTSLPPYTLEAEPSFRRPSFVTPTYDSFTLDTERWRSMSRYPAQTMPAVFPWPDMTMYRPSLLLHEPPANHLMMSEIVPVTVVQPLGHESGNEARRRQEQVPLFVSHRVVPGHWSSHHRYLRRPTYANPTESRSLSA